MERIPIREGRVRGTLFLPERTNPEEKLPLIVTLYGGVIRGKVVEEKAACLTRKGQTILNAFSFNSSFCEAIKQAFRLSKHEGNSTFKWETFCAKFFR